MAMRVYKLAKELGLNNREMLAKLNNLGISVTSHMNVISEEVCDLARKNAGRKETSVGSKSVKKDGGSVNVSENAKDAPKKKTAEQGVQKDLKDEDAKNGKNIFSTRKDKDAEGKGKFSGIKNKIRRSDKQSATSPAAKNGRTGEKKNADDAGKNTADKQKNAKMAGAQRNAKNAEAHKTDFARKKNNGAANANRQDPRNTRRGAANRNNNVHGSGTHTGGYRAGGRNENRAERQGSRNNQRPSNERNNGRNDRNDRNFGNDRNDRNDNREKRRSLSKPQHKTKKDQRKEQRKEQRREEAKKAEEAAAIPAGAVSVTVPITVKGLSEQIDVSPSDLIMTLMKMGIMANLNQNLDEDTVQILGDELGKQIIIGKVEEDDLEEGIENFEDKEEDLQPRPPIITVMGHVDHGKTSLLDKIRHSSVTEHESGGITQHIGASEIVHEGQRIVFLDTPGHEAFTAMRARGAYVTDIAVLVVAADDSVKPQTVEAISHAKAAGVPIIVAINKIDKPGANPDKVKQDLMEHGVLVEDWGGEVISVPVSAKTGEGIENLLEMILLQAEMLELKANPNRRGLGSVIEARLDRHKGPVATLLILNGTLQVGTSIVAGNCSGKIKAMTNFKGERLKKAGPATAVEILGLSDVPEAGDNFNAVSSDKLAREIAEKRKLKQREQIMQKKAGITLDQLFDKIEQGEMKELNLIVKADVQGSVGALVTSFEKLKNDKAVVKILHTGVGAINESDVMLAGTTDAVIIGFNVRPSAAVASMAQRDDVEIRTYSVIYEAIEDVEKALAGMLAPELREEVIGNVEVRNTFRVPGAGTVAGGYVTNGKVERNAGVRLVRDGIVIHEGKISSLKRFKDDVKEVNHGYECGIGIENYNDIKEGDIIEAFKMVELEKTTD